MVNNGLIEDRLNQIRISVKRLKQCSAMTQIEFSSNPDNFAIAEHHLRRALEALFDIGRHILAKQGFGKPDSYRQVIKTLGMHQVIPREFAEKIIGMAGYRNRLTHGYADISNEELWSILQNRLEDFHQFFLYIQAYVQR